MGAMSQSWFCVKGHRFAYCAKDEVMDKPTKCSVCGSKDVKCVYDWGRDDVARVPTKPIGSEDLWQEDHYKNKYAVKVNVYDISKLFEKKSLLVNEVVCLELAHFMSEIPDTHVRNVLCMRLGMDKGDAVFYQFYKWMHKNKLIYNYFGVHPSDLDRFLREIGPIDTTWKV